MLLRSLPSVSQLLTKTTATSDAAGQATAAELLLEPSL